MDKEFTFKYGRKQTGVRNGLLIHNQARCGIFMQWNSCVLVHIYTFKF